PRC
ncbi:hypothetical protein BVRB_015650, partial [Beta vulgaris subsp. vulgaris]